MGLKEGGLRGSLRNVSVGVGIPDSGVSRWEFEQDVTDSWDANPWTDNTSAGFTTTAQYGTYAKEFDGTDDYLQNGDIITETGAWTLSAWIYVTDTDQAGIYGTDTDAGSPRGFQFKVDNDDTLQLFDGNTAHNTTATVSRNTYQFVALATQNDGDVTVDVNGTKEDITADFNDTTFNLVAGVPGEGRVGYLTGYIDDGRYHDKKLSDNELNNLRTTGSISG